MPYTILTRASASKTLKRIDTKNRIRIAEKIYNLGQNPDDPNLDIMPMKGSMNLLRMRIGKWRVIFTRDDIVRIIGIEKIGSRGDVYKK